MARVPTYDNFEVQRAAGSTPALSAPPVALRTAGGDTLSRGAAQLSQGVDRFADTLLRLQQEKTEAAAAEADVRISDAIRSVLTDPDRGYLNLKGRNAIDAYKDARANVDTLIREQVDAINNPAVRSAVSRAAAQRRGQALGQIDGHYAGEMVSYRDEASRARVTSALQDAAAHWRDPEALKVARATLVDEVSQLAQRRGVDPVSSRNTLVDATTGLHKAVLGAMLANDQGQRALEYFAENAEEITPAERDDIKKSLTEATVRSASMKLADQLTDVYAGTDAQLDRARAMFDAGEITAEVRDATEQRIWSHYSRTKALDAFDGGQGIGDGDPAAIAPSEGGVRELVGRLFPNAQITGGTRSPGDPLSRANPNSWHIKGQALDVAPVPGVTFNEFVGKLRGAGLQIIEAKNEVGPGRSKWATGDHWHVAWRGAAPNAAIKTDSEAYAYLVQAMVEDPVNFAKAFDPAKWADKLSPSDLRGFVDKAATISNQGQKAADTFAGRKQALTSLSAELAAIGIDTTPKVGSNEAKQFARYKTALMGEIDREEAKQGRVLTAREMIAIGRGLMVEGSVDGAGWFGGGKAKRFYELDSSDERRRFSTPGRPSVASYALPYAQIPASARAWISRFWKEAYGAEPTKAEIAAVYPDLKARGRVD